MRGAAAVVSVFRERQLLPLHLEAFNKSTTEPSVDGGFALGGCFALPCSGGGGNGEWVLSDRNGTISLKWEALSHAGKDAGRHLQGDK